MDIRKFDDLSQADRQDQKRGTSPTQELRKLRIAKLNAEKEKLEVEMSEVQGVSSLSARNQRLKDILRELDELK